MKKDMFMIYYVELDQWIRDHKRASGKMTHKELEEDYNRLCNRIESAGAAGNLEPQAVGMLMGMAVHAYKELSEG